MDRPPHIPSAHLRRRAILAFATIAAACLSLPAAGQAAISSFGSDLSLPADTSRERGEDTAYWSSALPSGAARVPADGQIRAIKLKGMAIKRGSADPDNRVHFQTLRPQPDGSTRVIVTSQMFWVPFTGDANQVNTFHPENMCAQAGDYIAFNTVGGFNPNGGYPAGTPYRIFSVVDGAATRHYSHDEGTKNGALFPAPPTLGHPYGLNTEVARTELLMQMELGTGPDGTGLCQGGTAGLGGGGGAARPAPVRKFAGLLMPPLQAAWASRRGVLPVRVRCPSLTPGGCKGSLTLTSAKPIGSARKRLQLGSASFTLGANTMVKIPVKLSKKAARHIRRRGSLRATMKAVSVDGNGQRKTTSSTVAIKRGRR